MARIYNVVRERVGRDNTHLYELVGILVYGRGTCRYLCGVGVPMVEQTAVGQTMIREKT